MTDDEAADALVAAVFEDVDTGGASVDPVTGELAGAPDDWTCPDCNGDGRLPDRTGGGHHRCRACGGTGHQDPSCDNCTVPDCNTKQEPDSATMGCGGESWMHGEGPEPETMVKVRYGAGKHDVMGIGVGERTRFGTLIYTVAADALGVTVETATDWRILDPSGHEVDPHILIPPTSYGCTYTVERRAS